jgi:hypothetical protein
VRPSSEPNTLATNPTKVFLACLLVTLLAHGVSLQAPLHFDDLHQIVENEQLQTWEGFPGKLFDPWVGSSLGHATFFRPILLTTFLVDWTIGGGSPFPFRVTSLLLLAIFATVLWNTLIRLGTLSGLDEARFRPAFFAACLVFCAHPLLNESVLLATGRSTLLMAVFAIASLRVFIGEQSPRRLPLAAALLALALLTKESAVVMLVGVPLTFLAVDGLAKISSRWREVLLTLGVVGAYWIVRSWVLSRPPPEWATPTPTSLNYHIDLLDQVTQGFIALLGFIKLLFVPWGLSLVHQVPVPQGGAALASLLGWLLIVALPLVGLVSVKSALKCLTCFAILWWLLALSPSLLSGLNYPMGEHRVVLAMLGPVLLLGLALQRVGSRQHVQIMAGALILVFATLSTIQTLPWRSALDLWRHEVKVTPESSRGWSSLAEAEFNAGNHAAAMKSIRTSLSLAPGHWLHLSQATDYALAQGDLAAAEDFIARALSVDPTLLSMQLNAAKLRAMQNRLPEALTHAQKAIEIAPLSSIARNHLGNIQWMMGDAACVSSYAKAVELDPQNEEARINLDRARQRFGATR